MKTAELRKGLLRLAALRTALMLLLLAAMLGGILHLSTSKADHLAMDRQNRLARIAIDQSMAAVSNDQEASTYWDDAVVRTRERPLDLGWIDNNLGVWFHTYYGHDEAYILDSANRPIYAMQNGARTEPGSFTRVKEPVLGLAARLRQRLAGGYLATDRSRGRTVGEVDMAVIAGRPAIVSLKPIVPETDRVDPHPASEYLHVAVRYLDGSFLARLSRFYGIEGANFTDRPSTSASLAIRDQRGQVLGYLNWTPFEPGEEVGQRMLPALLIALLFIGLVMGVLATKAARSRMELEASRAQAQHLAFHDSLTGLPNRALFENRLDHAVRRRDARIAVLMLDLDRFKHVNDTLGHPAGDVLIRAFARRLAALTRDCDTISRLGGDEFAILVEGDDSRAMQALAERILEDVSRPFDVVGNQVHVEVSIGIALGSGSGTKPSEIVRKADIALYRAKENGRNNCCLFSPEMDASVQLRSTIEEELREALISGRGLCLYYQPQVEPSGAIVGLEALVRWDHPTRGIIAPEQFVPVAEECGLIVPLGEWVMTQACRASRRWPHLFIGINLSPVQFRSRSLFDRAMAIVRATGADPRAIQLEVTERVLLDDDETVKASLDRLRAAGFAIALDDFGTGYSSLSYLHKFPVDKIKIDRSFVEHLGEATDSSAIVTAILALGHAMGLTVAAEGVESEEQRQFLVEAGCDVMQGFYFSRPVPFEALEALVGVEGAASVAA